MNWFNSLITAFCTAGICFGALFIISPSGKMERSVKYVLSLCFLIIVITISGVKMKMSDFDINFNTVSSVDADELENSATEYTIALVLQKAGIDFREIYVSTDNLETDGISCTKVKIYTDCDRQKIVNILGEETENFKVEVINE
jgi:hypothetical protein